MRRAVEHQRPMVTKSGWTSHSPSGLCLQIAGVPVDLLKLLLITTKAEQMLLSRLTQLPVPVQGCGNVSVLVLYL